MAVSPVVPTVDATSNGPCVSTTTNEFMYSFIGPSNALPPGFSSIRGIESTVWSSSRLWNCTGTSHDPEDGSMYWISVQPAPDTRDQCQVYANCILQIGVIRCLDSGFFPQAICDGTPHLFRAAGGCVVNGISYYAIATDMGPAPGGAITFSMQRLSGSGNWFMEAGTSNGIYYYEHPATSVRTSCWLSGTGDNQQAVLACERWDQGDGCGDSVSRVGFLDIKFQKSIGGTWWTPDSVASGGDGITTQLSCNDIDLSDENCLITRPDEARYWND